MSSKRRPLVTQEQAGQVGGGWVGPDGVTYPNKAAFYAKRVAEEQGDGYPDWFPAGMRTGSVERGLMVSQLVTRTERRRELDDVIAEEVVKARALGASWGLVGLALGISSEGARSRYGRK